MPVFFFFFAIPQEHEVHYSSLTSLFLENNSSLRYSILPCWHIMKHVECGGGCQFYGIVMLYKRHKRRHRCTEQVVGVSTGKL